MSGAHLIPPQGEGAATAPATGTAAPVAPVAGVAGGSPFDAILMLEALAAAAAGAGVDTGAAQPGTDAADPATDDPADDEESQELDDPLAFLAGLIAVAPRPHRVHVDAAGVGAGGAGEGAAGLAPPPGEPEASGIPFLSGADAITTDGKAADAAGAARSLAAHAALNGMEAQAEDPSAATRAVDYLTPTSRPAPSGHATMTQIATHVRDPRWAEEFGTRVALLVNQRESVAAISLTPADLGPVDVSITVRDSQATIHFGAAQADTRALIEASLPKLRELLAAQGFQLLDASVSQGFTRQSQPDAPSVPRPTNVEEVPAMEARATSLIGLLDTYA